MKELIERLRYPVLCTLDDRLEAADALERLTTESAALKEGLDGWHARFLDCEVEFARLVDVCHAAKLILATENAALKEQMTADRKQFLDMRNERDALAQNAERVRVYKQRYFGAIAERDALRADAYRKDSLLLWALYHHQGGYSLIGQPIRKLFGLGQFDELSIEQIAKARSAAIAGEKHD